jgi:hypothetical protein
MPEAATVMFCGLPIEGAITCIMYNHYQITLKLPDLKEKQSLMLC